jgi:sulfur-oxidizing protein SoxY
MLAVRIEGLQSVNKLQFSEYALKHVPELMTALGMAAPVESTELTVEALDIAPNSAFVLLGAATALPGVQRLLLLVEKNPNLMSAMFELSDAVEASVMLRVKMRESSNVLAAALMRDGRVLYAQKRVEIAQGGCDG